MIMILIIIITTIIVIITIIIIIIIKGPQTLRPELPNLAVASSEVRFSSSAMRATLALTPKDYRYRG